MKTLVVAVAVLAVSLSAVPAVGAPAGPAPPSIDQRATAQGMVAAVGNRTLYMVRNLKRSGAIWTGKVAVIRKQGRRAIGIQGALYSEYRCLEGRIRGGRIQGTYPAYRYGDRVIPEAPLDERWIGKGNRQRMAGWSSVTAKRMKRISGGGVTKRLIRIC